MYDQNVMTLFLQFVTNDSFTSDIKLMFSIHLKNVIKQSYGVSIVHLQQDHNVNSYEDKERQQEDVKKAIDEPALLLLKQNIVAISI